MKRLLPKLDWITVHRNQAAYRLPYCFRKGNGGPALLFVHGLGGCKENFYAAFQTAALADCDLLTFDFPGTGLAEFDATTCPDVSTLAELAHLVWKALLPGPVFLVVASMGGLVGLLMMRNTAARELRLHQHRRKSRRGRLHVLAASHVPYLR